jgi:hypothetical protein
MFFPHTDDNTLYIWDGAEGAATVGLTERLRNRPLSTLTGTPALVAAPVPGRYARRVNYGQFPYVAGGSAWSPTVRSIVMGAASTMTLEMVVKLSAARSTVPFGTYSPGVLFWSGSAGGSDPTGFYHNMSLEYYPNCPRSNGISEAQWLIDPRTYGIRWRTTTTNAAPYGHLSVNIDTGIEDIGYDWLGEWTYLIARRNASKVVMEMRSLERTWVPVEDQPFSGPANWVASANTNTNELICVGAWANAGALNQNAGSFDFAGARLSNVVRTSAQLEQAFAQLKTYVAGEPDSTPPAITNMTPTPGSALLYSQPIAFDVTDEAGLRRIVVLASFEGKEDFEVVHDGDRFAPRYSASPNARSTIEGGYHYNVLRRGGWPGPPTLTCHAIDAGGNEAT